MQLKGFDVEMRTLSLRGFNNTVRVLPSYGEVQVRTRSGECDVGWAQFFQLSSRASCISDSTTCRAVDEAIVAAVIANNGSWGPYR